MLNKHGRTSELGSFELYVLAAVQRLGDDAYGTAIQSEIQSSSGRTTAVGSVYVTLERLARKGFVTFHVSPPLAVPGGRGRKCARMTNAGLRAFRETVATLDRMLAGARVAPTAAGRR